MAIKTITLKSWSEIHNYLKPSWLYRGQRSADWDLKTSLDRCFERQSVPNDKRSFFELELLRDFRRAYHQYGSHIPDAQSAIEWFSLMQHHGSPTRLLDFTYSIYVAAYFALELADNDCAVWALNGPWALNESVSSYLNVGKSNANKLQAPTQEAHETVSYHLLFESPIVKAAVPLTPFRLNERLRIQKGTFLAPGDLTSSFMENLLSLPGHDDSTNLIKLVLPFSVRTEALESLYYMNISRTSLFPGLDGYAQSLGIFHPLFKMDTW